MIALCAAVRGNDYMTQDEIFDELDEMDLASRLLEAAGDEREIDQFLGAVIRKAVKRAGQTIGPQAVGALKGLLKRAAKKALPAAGDADQGESAEVAERIFNLEMEGLSPEDREFETARRFVRFAGSAARNTASASRRGNPRMAARAGTIQAARRFAPGFLRPRGPRRRGRGGATMLQASGRGHWIRQGRNIIIVNCAPAPPGEPPSAQAAGDMAGGDAGTPPAPDTASDAGAGPGTAAGADSGAPATEEF
jgi:hypothetical protein